jgi:hypothetical protein
LDRERLSARIADVLPREERSEDETRDIVFHMVDWLEDLERRVEVARDPDVPDEEFSHVLYCFLA